MANSQVGSKPTSGKKQAGGIYKDLDGTLASNVKAVEAESAADYGKTAYRQGDGKPPGEGPNRAKIRQYGAGMD